MGEIAAICISTVRGVQKVSVNEAELIQEWGIKDDAHAGHWHRQVSLLSIEKIKDFREKGGHVAFGAFGENLVVQGFDLSKLPVGTLLQCGNNVLLEITQIGKECHDHCAIYKSVGDCIMPREGIFARVLKGGIVRIGDCLEIVARTVKRPYQAAVITLSDKGSRGEREDVSGPLISERLQRAGYEVVEKILIADDAAVLRHQLCRLADQRQLDLVATTGGTGFAPRDITPEATLAVATKNVPGIAEAMRSYSLHITPRAMFSRAVSVIRHKTLIINFPGSPAACEECLDCILDTLPHGLAVLRGEVTECARR